ncbi:hypothetical protein LTR78_009670 [Recurvomyces mirabilis]|uniref:Ribosome biogenesis protein SLX9 n=1 Tax=Recurvomyces mirabilis TaxID=574656 RepID=A0AAE0TP25_9PEZI|nr:hypothetical protein LTR78_009670 [Recurvomyces mirabilis]KAK5150288.1 hypothetical protein LTS14_010265 [Recurvomyces mirabilis]
MVALTSSSRLVRQPDRSKTASHSPKRESHRALRDHTMAPIRQTKHSRGVRSAKDPRGIYAPPATSFAPADDTLAAPSTSTSNTLTQHRDADDDFTSFKTTKKDKRGIRHETLLAKARESSRKGGAAGRVVKRRRAGRKLKVDLGGLGDALPEAGEGGGGGGGGGDGETDEWVGLSDDEDAEMNGDVPAGLRKVRKKKPMRADGGAVGGGKMVMKSLRHRPGAMKRKGVMEEKERERFGRNLAGMVGRVAPRSAAVGGGAGAEKAGEGSQQAEKWAALRRFIGGTMERSAAFGGEKT